MESYADAVVGSVGEGLNVEQRKVSVIAYFYDHVLTYFQRLTIGVELAAKVGSYLWFYHTSGLLTVLNFMKLAPTAPLFRRTYVRTILPECMGHHWTPPVSRWSWTSHPLHDPSTLCGVVPGLWQATSFTQGGPDLLLRRPREQYHDSDQVFWEKWRKDLSRRWKPCRVYVEGLFLWTVLLTWQCYRHARCNWSRCDGAQHYRLALDVDEVSRTTGNGIPTSWRSPEGKGGSRCQGEVPDGVFCSV